jgi:hypothetical protein
MIYMYEGYFIVFCDKARKPSCAKNFSETAKNMVRVRLNGRKRCCRVGRMKDY